MGAPLAVGGMVPPNGLVPGFAVVPYTPGDPAKDANDLYHAMKGAGTNDSVLINILGNRSKEHLQQVQLMYESLHKKTLEHDLRGDTSLNYGKLARYLLLLPLQLKITYLRDSMKGISTGAGTYEGGLIDVICMSSNAELAQIKAMYPGLEKEVEKETSGNFRKVLMELLKCKRDESIVVNERNAEADADAFYRAGEKKLGTDDSKFIEILTTRSVAHLAAMDRYYVAKHKHGIARAIEKETSGDYKDALIACTQPWHIYFADRIRYAIKGAGTDDRGLIYAFSVNDKSQLALIAKTFRERHGRSIVKDVEGDTSGDYRKLLLAVMPAVSY
jgi:hypothetical protein